MHPAITEPVGFDDCWAAGIDRLAQAALEAGRRRVRARRQGLQEEQEQSDCASGGLVCVGFVRARLSLAWAGGVCMCVMEICYPCLYVYDSVGNDSGCLCGRCGGWAGGSRPASLLLCFLEFDGSL